MRSDSLDEPERVRGLARSIGDDVERVWHDDVGQDEEAAGVALLVQGRTKAAFSASMRNIGRRSLATAVMERQGESREIVSMKCRTRHSLAPNSLYFHRAISERRSLSAQQGGRAAR